MSVLETILDEQSKASGTVLDELLDVSAPKQLSTPDQLYMNNIAIDLGQDPYSINTLDDWQALNSGESARIKAEEEGSLKSSVLDLARTGEGSKTVELKALGLAKLDSLGEEVPHAAAISAARERLAQSYTDNPENGYNSIDFQRWEQIYNEKAAILEDFSRAIDRKETSIIKNLVVDTLPFSSTIRVSNALKAIGFKDIDEYSYDDMMLAFGTTMMGLVSNGEVSPLSLIETLKDIENKWDEAGVDPWIQREIVQSLLKFSPGSESLNDTLRITGVIPGTLLIGKGAKALAAGKKAEALYHTVRGTADIAIPFGDSIVKYSSNKVLKGVNVLKGAYENLPLSRAKATKNRAKLAEIAEEQLGAPTEKGRPWKYSNKKGAYVDYTDHALHPVGEASATEGNEVYSLGLKIEKEANQVFNKTVSQEQHLRTLLREGYGEFAAGPLIDTLRADKIIGAGRGVGIKEILSAFDNGNIMLSKEDRNITIAVKLKNPVNDAEYRSVRFENYPLGDRPKDFDTGFLNAVERGKKLTKASSDPSVVKGYRVNYGIDEDTGVYYTTLYIDTNKGFGSLNFDRLQKAGEFKDKTQEGWRSVLSSVATATSDPKDIQIAHVAREMDNSQARELYNSAMTSWNALAKNERKIVQGAIDVSTRYEAFYTPEQLLASGWTPEMTKVYTNWRVINDVDDYFRNEATRLDLSLRGAKSITYNGKRIAGAGRVVPNINSWTELRDTVKSSGRGLIINNVDLEDATIVGVDTIERGQWEYFFNNGYRLIEGSLSPEDGYGARTFYYLLDPKGTVINELPEFVTSYVAGGRNYYQRNRGFLKQLRMEGDKIVGVNTFFTDPDLAGMTRLSNKLEEIRRLIISGKDSEATAAIAAAKFHKAPFGDASGFREFFEKRGMDFTHMENSLEVVKNDKILKSYNVLRDSGVDDLVGFDEMERISRNSHYQAISNEAKEKRLMRTGRELLTWDFEKAQPVDFEMQLRYLVNDMVYGGYMNDFTEMYADRFYRAYKGAIRQPRGYKLTAREALISGNAIEDGSDVSRMAKTAQLNYAAIRGVPTKLDTMLADNFKRLMEWVGGAAEKILPISEEAAHSVRVNWFKIAEKDYLTSARAFASHWYLGMCNISQLWKQMGSDAAILLLEPKAAASAAKDSLSLTYVLMSSGGNKTKALKTAYKMYKNNPTMLQNARNIIEMGAFEHGTAGGFIEKGASTSSTFNKISMLFFNSGEMQNRSMAFLTALKARGFDGKKMSAAERLSVSRYANDLFLNMDAAGLARVQRGSIEKTLFQFMGYRMRWLESVLFNKDFTAAQRARLGLGTLALTGTEGMLGAGAAAWVGTNVYNLFHDPKDTDATDVERNEITEFIQKGLLNYFSDVFGLDMDIAQPLSLEYFDMFDSILGLAQLDFAAPQVAGKALSSFFEIVKYVRDTAIGEANISDLGDTIESLAIEGKLPSSVRLYLGARLWKTGRALNTKGELTEYYNSKLRTTLYALGFNSLTSKELVKAWTQSSESAESVKACRDAAYEMLMRYLRTGSERDYNLYFKIIKLSGLHELQQAQILNDTMNEASEKFNIDAKKRMFLRQIEAAGLNGDNFIKILYNKGE